MGNTTVRIPKGYQGKEQLKIKLEELTNNELTFVEYESKPDPLESFSQRKDSIREAFQFLAKTLLPNIIDYEAYAEACELSCQFNNDANFNQKEFNRFLGRLASIIVRDYPWPTNYQGDKTKDVLLMLDRAEQFCILKKGRPDLITLIQVQQKSEKQDETELTSLHPFLIWDEQHSSLSPKTIDALRKLKASISISPSWFAVLPTNIRFFIHHLCSGKIGITEELTSLTITSIINELYSLSLKNSVTHFENIDSHSPPKWFTNLELPIQESLLFLKKNKLTWENVKTEIQNIFNCIQQFPTNQNKTEFFRKLTELPAWYINLKPHEQIFLKALLDEKEPEELSFFCSRFGLIEGLANYGSTKIIDYETMTTLIGQSRSSHPVRRDVLPTTDTPENIRQQFTEANLAQLMAKRELPFLFLQPLNGSGIPKLKVTEDYYMAVELERAAQSFSPNKLIMRHVLNDLNNWIENTPRQTTNPFVEFVSQHLYLKELTLNESTDIFLNNAFDAKKLDKNYETYWQAAIIKLKENRKEYLAKLEMVSEILKEYIAILNSPETDNNREMWLANLENEMMYILGIEPHSFCVSGKDRAQLHILHQFDRQIYRVIYGKRPNYSDTGENRQNFINIFDSLFECGHGQRMASFSATGCTGIKNTNWYLKKDLYTSLKSVSTYDVIAGLNELAELSIKAEDISLELHQVLKLTAEQRIELFDLLKTMVLDKEFWSDKTNSYQSTPTHVGQMSTKFNPGFFQSVFGFMGLIKISEIPEEIKLTAIFNDAKKAMVTTSAKRDPRTVQFYEYIVNLFKEGENPADKFKETMDNLIRLYKPAEAEPSNLSQITGVTTSN